MSIFGTLGAALGGALGGALGSVFTASKTPAASHVTLSPYVNLPSDDLQVTRTATTSSSTISAADIVNQDITVTWNSGGVFQLSGAPSSTSTTLNGRWVRDPYSDQWVFVGDNGFPNSFEFTTYSFDAVTGKWSRKHNDRRSMVRDDSLMAFDDSPEWGDEEWS